MRLPRRRKIGALVMSRIVIIENDPLMRSLLAEWLAAEGYGVESVAGDYAQPSPSVDLVIGTGAGRLTVDDERVINLPKGLLGFPNHTRFALIQTGEENYFFWLQSVDTERYER